MNGKMQVRVQSSKFTSTLDKSFTTGLPMYTCFFDGGSATTMDQLLNFFPFCFMQDKSSIQTLKVWQIINLVILLIWYYAKNDEDSSVKIKSDIQKIWIFFFFFLLTLSNYFSKLEISASQVVLR